MREMLFRGKCVANGEWIEGFAYEHEPPLTCFSGEGKEPSKWYIVKTAFADWNMSRGVDMIEVDPNTVSEFTGFKDKNGKRIFEGHIVVVTDDDGDVEFCNGGNGNIIMECGMWYVAGNPQNSLYDLSRMYHIEVIGNIHDNPELLKP